MPSQITIAAVGDILLQNSIIRSAKLAKQDSYDFSPIFRHVAPLLSQADLTIGNLEIPLAGREHKYTRKNAKTGFYTFNGPDEIVSCLKQVGFNVLLTGNNHCLDRGFDGLQRTLTILDQYGFAHTGTYRTEQDSTQFLELEIKGIRLGITSYSKSTNKIPIPRGKPWCVNLLDQAKMVKDLLELRKRTDLTIVCPHFGKEYRHMPTRKQRRIVQSLLKHGADLILGNHPHVPQPAVSTNSNQHGIFSLGNFISTTLMNNPFTRHGVIMLVTITKDEKGIIQVDKPHYVPTWIRRSRSSKGISYEIIPCLEKQQISELPRLSYNETTMMKRAAEHTKQILNTKIPMF